MKFERGYYIDSETSNYSNYTDKKFDSLAINLKTILFKIHLNFDSNIVDFGCATG